MGTATTIEMCPGRPTLYSTGTGALTNKVKYSLHPVKSFFGILFNINFTYHNEKKEEKTTQACLELNRFPDPSTNIAIC